MSNKDYMPLPELIDQDIIDRASKLSAAVLCDGMEDLGLQNGSMDASMMPVDPSMKMIGTACTVSTEDGDNLPIHIAIYQSKPGYVLVVDGKAYTKRAYMGDMMIGAAKAIGLNGVVLDGYLRDREGLIELGLPAFGNGFMQRTPAKKGPGKINVPINCSGVTVNPGDLVVGDYDGVTVVPRDRILEVLEAAEKKEAYEVERLKIMEDYTKKRIEEKELPEIAPEWVIEMTKK